MDFTIKKNEVTKYGTMLKNYTADFDTQIKKFNSILDNINSAWEGADALKYINIMKEKNLTNMNELTDILNEYGNYLTKIPGAYSNLDEIFTSRKIDV